MQDKTIGRRGLFAAGAAALALPCPALAQARWPAGRSIEVIVGFAPGGGTDVMVRALGLFLAAEIPGANFVVLNRPGAGGETAYVALQSRGEPIEAHDDPRLAPFIDKGRAAFNQRQGQLNLSCGQCHDDNWGKHLAGNTVPQAHPTGYPTYRLEWQSLGSLQRRLRNCMIGMRAEPYAYGAPEYVDMELFLMWRARGMKIETPAVRP